MAYSQAGLKLSRRETVMRYLPGFRFLAMICSTLSIFDFEMAMVVERPCSSMCTRERSRFAR